ncbi:MAG: AMP nucleosidase, partial [Aestuariivita sp.]|nr:AMP nucleosidase [Aestuariivita sp.]
MSVNASSANIHSPDQPDFEEFKDAALAVEKLQELYRRSIEFLNFNFLKVAKDGAAGRRYRAFYPEIRIKVDSFIKTDSRLSFGQISSPGTYEITITRPDLFANYLIQQIGLLLKNYNIEITVGNSDTPIPLHFAIRDDANASVSDGTAVNFALRDVFDVPDLSSINDNIVDGNIDRENSSPLPLAPFTAQRVDYSLARLSHYTATDPRHFQNYVLFTNYQFYVAEFEAYARKMLLKQDSGYESFVGSGGYEIFKSDRSIPATEKTPQMPSYHLKRADGNGITLVNIGVGPSNAKTATDHIAVLRPHAWLMVGHCAGLRNSQNLGDLVLAHAYVREDKVLDDDLPVWVPVPALAEIQIALETAVAQVTKLEGYDLKKIMRTGTVATVDNRN